MQITNCPIARLPDYTYHRWARQDQVERCYSPMREFLALERQDDPDEVFQSTWYRHYRTMFESV